MKKYFLKYKWKVTLGALTVLALALLILPAPLILKRIIDNSIPHKNLDELIFLIGLTVLILITARILAYAKTMIFSKLNAKIIIDIKKDLISKLNQISKNEHERFSNGYLINRINKDTERLKSLFADTMVNILKDALTFVFGLIAIFIINWKLALISIVLLPFFLLTTFYFTRLIRKKSNIYYENQAQMSKSLEETLNLKNLVSILLRRKFSSISFYHAMKENFRSFIALRRTSTLHAIIAGFLAGLAPVLVIAFGGYEIINNRMTLGALIAFNSYVKYLFGPTGRLINVNVQIQKALIAFNRIQELFDLKDEPFDSKFKIPQKIYSLTLENVSFSYESEKQILHNFSAKINFGERIGIVGGSGSGKSTLLNIIIGLYKINSGKILLNNQEINQSQLVALRNSFAYIEQEPVLFNGTIYENIKLGKRNSTKEEIIAAARKANAHNFINELDNKYQTKIKYKGSNLSVGQKQRIAIARALVRNPQILIMDEATSNIDTLSEKKISEAIEKLPKNMIVIIVAHRLSTIKNCDKILVMENGKICESGKHQDLLQQKGSYAKMVNV